MGMVWQILERKGRDVWSVGPDQTVYEAIVAMSERDVGCVLVVDSGRLVGMLTEREYSRRIVIEGRSSLTTRVREIMIDRVACVAADMSVDACMALMTRLRTRYLPVIEGLRVVGMLSIGDVVKSVIDEQQYIIDQLGHYILGDYARVEIPATGQVTEVPAVLQVPASPTGP